MTGGCRRSDRNHLYSSLLVRRPSRKGAFSGESPLGGPAGCHLFPASPVTDNLGEVILVANGSGRDPMESRRRRLGWLLVLIATQLGRGAVTLSAEEISFKVSSRPRHDG